MHLCTWTLPTPKARSWFTTTLQADNKAKDAVSGSVEVFQIKNDGVGEFLVGLETNLLSSTRVSGAGFDKGLWAQDTGLPVPTYDTAITRNASLEVVDMTNLRVGSRTSDPKKMENGEIVSDAAGTLAGYGVYCVLRRFVWREAY